MPNSDAAQPVADVLAERAALAHGRRISDAQYDILNFLRNHNWAAHALDLVAINPCNYRARISELRNDFGIAIEADPPHPPRGTASTYKVPPQCRPRAEYLLEHLSLQGFSDAPVQGGLFDA